MVKTFLANYQAFPLFRTNPVFPGDVLQLNETRLLSYKTCYAQVSQKPGNYARIPDFKSGMAVAVDASAEFGGNAIDSRLLEAEAGGGVKIARSVTFTLAPLSVEGFEPDAASLSRWDRTKPECAVIGEMLGGRGGYFLVADVLHGTVNFTFEATVSAGIGAKAQGELLVRVSRAFAIDKAAIRVSGSTLQFSAVSSPDPHTLAVVPAKLSHEELARITHYLRGKRGTDLEIAVNEAVRTTDLNQFQAILVRIRALLADDIGRREAWAKRFVSGDDMRDTAALTLDKELSFRDIANYAAAMVLTDDNAGLQISTP